MRAPPGVGDSTQVSLLPPPCDEFTTSEPLRSATRVSPPGRRRCRRRRGCTAAGRRAGPRGDRRPASARATAPASAGRCSCAGWPRSSPANASRSAAVDVRADQHAVAAGLVGRLDHQLVQVLQHVLPLRIAPAQEGRHVGEDRVFAQVVPDHLRHVGVHHLVVGDAVARRVGQRHAAGAIGVHQARHAQHRVGAERLRVEEVVVDAAVDHVDPPQALGRPHPDVSSSTTRSRPSTSGMPIFCARKLCSK